jgi:hypothetical protein
VADRTWHVTTQVIFPNQLGGPPGPGGGLPAQLTPESRVPMGSWRIRDADVFVYEVDKGSLPQIRDDLRFGLAEIAVRRDSPAQEPLAAALEAAPILDQVLESMSFQMQTALQVQGVRAIDLTGSPSTGDERRFGQWSGLALPTFRSVSVPVGSLVGRLIPEPGLELDPADTRANRALDWYLKALAAQYEADHFIFLWIACEILAADSDLTVEAPYKARCGHVIERCPDCGNSTARPAQGPSMKRWLTERFGVSGELADGAWKARQMLHGAHAFQSAVVEELPELNQWLRHVVVTELKARLGVAPHEPPLAAVTGLAISPYMGIAGSAQVTELDLNPVA